MDFDFGPDAEKLRHRLRELVDAHLPTDFLGAFTHDEEDQEVVDRFIDILAAEGLLTLAWPEEYGGRAASVWEQTVVREEMWAHHEPRGAQYMGLNWVGPALMRFGTDEQKREFLPRIAQGEIVWCQGFSEPEAGSDLASLRTAARATDGGWLITGQKVWTSYATLADYCVLAARTAQDGKKQHGITLFLIPMDREGVEVRPIESMLGPHHLNEVFLDDVWASPGEVLGEVDEGWTVMREALVHERIGIARYARCDRLIALLRARLAEEQDDLPDGLSNRISQALVSTRVARLLSYRALAEMEAGRLEGPAVPAARIATTQNDQTVGEALVEALGPRWLAGGAGAPDDLDGPEDVLVAAVEDHWRYSQAATVASGSLEVQKMLLARELWRTG